MYISIFSIHAEATIGAFRPKRSTHQVEQEIKSEKQISDAGVGYHAVQHFDRKL